MTDTDKSAADATPHKWGLARCGLVLSLLCIAVILGAVLGHRLGILHYSAALTVLRWVVWFGIGAAVISLAGCLFARTTHAQRNRRWGVLGLVIGLLVFAVPWWSWHKGQGLPPIHDISTNTDDPPQFVAVLPLRKNAPNKTDYDSKTAALQKKAYPQIAPAMLDQPPPQAFALAEATAHKMGWEIVADNPADMRIEATDTTALMGFKDDIVIRVSANGSGSRVDVRSVSRVGRSDFGTNARRVEAFLRELATLRSS